MSKQQKQALPKNWPPRLTYLTTPQYTHVSPPQRRQLQTQPATPLSEVPPTLRFGPSARVEIRAITDPAHPACGQHGLFAAQALAPGSFILPYYGTYPPGAGAGSARHARSDYDLWLDREANVAVDAERAGNEARFVNDYRGTGRNRPNAEFREVWDPRRGERGMAVFVVSAGRRRGATGAPAAKGIARGEEILVSYGKGFWEMRKGAEQKEGEGEARPEEARGGDDAAEVGGGDDAAEVADLVEKLAVGGVGES